MKNNFEDFEKALMFLAVWSGFTQSEKGDHLETFRAITGWDETRCKDAFAACVERGLVDRKTPPVLVRLAAKGLIEFDETGERIRITDAGSRVVEEEAYGPLISEELEEVEG